MAKIKERAAKIRKFIADQVSDHPKDITALTAREFGLSRPAVLRYINAMIGEKVLAVQGKTKDRHYALELTVKQDWLMSVAPDLTEDRVWREDVAPLLDNVNQNVKDICQYGLTEMLNNVVDHSEGTSVFVRLERTLASISITVVDDGIGIFRKIQTELHLDDPRHAILELAKGKFTTDPENHTGEGIFFTSRAFDEFSVASEGLFFQHVREEEDWLLGMRETVEEGGTFVSMKIHPDSDQRLPDIFELYAAEAEDYGFTRTIVPVVLAKYGDENLVSRSQAKRLLMRFERFKEVILDFREVETIGQAFADEVFRVYRAQHPEVHLIPLYANDQVKRMIKRVTEGSLQPI